MFPIDCIELRRDAYKGKFSINSKDKLYHRRKIT